MRVIFNDIFCTDGVCTHLLFLRILSEPSDNAVEEGEPPAEFTDQLEMASGFEVLFTTFLGRYDDHSALLRLHPHWLAIPYALL
jgi:hypothetical protein